MFLHENIDVYVNFLGFWNFSRNSLVGDKCSSGDSSLPS